MSFYQPNLTQDEQKKQVMNDADRRNKRIIDELAERMRRAAGKLDMGDPTALLGNDGRTRASTDVSDVKNPDNSQSDTSNSDIAESNGSTSTTIEYPPCPKREDFQSNADFHFAYNMWERRCRLLEEVSKNTENGDGNKTEGLVVPDDETIANANKQAEKRKKRNNPQPFLEEALGFLGNFSIAASWGVIDFVDNAFDSLIGTGSVAAATGAQVIDAAFGTNWAKYVQDAAMMLTEADLKDTIINRLGADEGMAEIFDGFEAAPKWAQLDGKAMNVIQGTSSLVCTMGISAIMSGAGAGAMQNFDMEGAIATERALHGGKLDDGAYERAIRYSSWKSCVGATTIGLMKKINGLGNSGINFIDSSERLAAKTAVGSTKSLVDAAITSWVYNIPFEDAYNMKSGEEKIVNDAIVSATAGVVSEIVNLPSNRAKADRTFRMLDDRDKIIEYYESHGYDIEEKMYDVKIIFDTLENVDKIYRERSNEPVAEGVTIHGFYSPAENSITVEDNPNTLDHEMGHIGENYPRYFIDENNAVHDLRGLTEAVNEAAMVKIFGSDYSPSGVYYPSTKFVLDIMKYTDNGEHIIIDSSVTGDPSEFAKLVDIVMKEDGIGYEAIDAMKDGCFGIKDADGKVNLDNTDINIIHHGLNKIYNIWQPIDENTPNFVLDSGSSELPYHEEWKDLSEFEQ